MSLILKGIIIYIAVTIAVRLMGKRQIGELQPGELVITFLLSEVAAMPLQGEGIPLLSSLTLVFLLVLLEITSSFSAMKSRGYRTLVQGNSVLIIKEGKIIRKNMKLLRYSTDDLIEALRLKDVFDISNVRYAYIETNGSISLQLKKEFQPLCVSDIKPTPKESFLPCLIISDGKIIRRDFSLCNMTDEKLGKLLKSKKLKAEDIFIMTADKKGNTFIVRKDDCN